MAHGTGMVADSEVTRGSQTEPDTEEIIDWKAEKAVEEARQKKLTIRIDLLGKLITKTQEGRRDVDAAIKVVQGELDLVKAKVVFYTNCIQHAYEVRAIRRIFGS